MKKPPAPHYAIVHDVRGAYLPTVARCDWVSGAEAAARWARANGAGECEFSVACPRCGYRRRYQVTVEVEGYERHRDTVL